ncbi:glycerophosphodiester phosphodiesterase family protein [Hyphobacterium sp. HN65]|uniref:Glycerophosphodiester phosphodiesterase family protein n=1 Tax=Hyphobacterium lacteum TaxID=3116575 RepID=A0ABU7LRT7_9PROT|nr:glycerophosphodiester phosphodiesterase family protein [Hyphobacterium sp. HN65]MEE2526624.1 glycerophosphodiester phosphodiesterase family protein [Hyphobacterium sp. HN65]
MIATLLAISLQAQPVIPPIGELLDCAREADATLVAIHRAGGFAPGIPENSLAGIRAAGEMGAAMVEIDLRLSSDGHVVLMHDRTLDRTTNGTGNVADHTLEELRALRLEDANGRRTNQLIPTLSEAFEAARAAGVYLELDLKEIGPGEAARLAVEAGMASQSMIIVYDVADADPIQAVTTDIGISLPFTDHDEVLSSELDVSGLMSWVGRGVPDAHTEYFLTGQGIETAMHDFPGEEAGTIDYAFIDERHIEVLATDDPEAALAAFGPWQRYCGIE